MVEVKSRPQTHYCGDESRRWYENPLDSNVRAGSSPASGTNFYFFTTMNKLKKIFQFSGTINGTNYFLRQLLAAVVAFVGGFSIGIGIVGMQNTTAMSVLLLLGIIVSAAGIWISLATMYKRFDALHPNQAGVYTISLFSLQTVSTMFSDGDTIGPVIKIVLVVIGLYLIFANSKIENHEG